VCTLWKFCPFTRKQPTSDTIYYLEYAHALKFLIDRRLSLIRTLIDIEANVIHSKYEELVKKKQEEENAMRQKVKRINEILLLFNRRMF